MEKELVLIIEYRIDVNQPPNLEEVLDKLREMGAAEVVDMRVEPKPSSNEGKAND
jgi:hypothetical protein